jgi:hypothetical protein
MKKGDKAADDEDDDAVRTCVSKTEIQKHYVLRICSSALRIYSSHPIPDGQHVGREG